MAGLKEGDVIPLDLFCDLPQALRSADGSTTGFVSDALARIGRRRRVVLTLPHFYGIGARSPVAASSQPFRSSLPV
jgi:hypothetical protein